MLEKFNLNGKVALVTGCNKGIGQACAKGLAEAGAEIIGVSRSGKFDATRSFIEEAGSKFTGYTCDFSERKDLYNFIEKLDKDFSKIDILVNNAGTILRKPALEHGDDYWDKVIEVNLNSQFVLSREIAKKMHNNGAGKIIFIASLLSFQGGITVPGYAASKGGIKTLTAALANEWAGKGINVNAIAPGYISTDNTEALRNDPDRSRTIMERIPAGRWGQAEDIAGAVVFLSSSASDYVHGTTLAVDGGWLGR